MIPSLIYMKNSYKKRVAVTTLFRTGGEVRTPDPRFWRPMLYQLSHSRNSWCKLR